MFPAYVDIGPFRYVCRLDKTGKYDGYAQHDKLEIVVGQDNAPDRKRETLLHEIIHCCIVVTSHIQQKRSDEEFVEHVTPVLLDALQRNPKVLRYLLREEAE